MSMQKRQVVALFTCSLAVWFVGASLTPLLPVYAASLGATPTVTGNYLAFSFLALSLGTIYAGRLSGRFRQYRYLIIGAACLCLPATWLMGRADAMWQLLALTMFVWFLAGVMLTLQNILTGLYADAHNRGGLFGLLASTAALAGLLGGLFIGPVADLWGFARMFSVVALVWGVAIGSGWFLPDKRSTGAASRSTQGVQLTRWSFDRSFLLVTAASLVTSLAVGVGLLGRTMTMDAQGLALTAITMLAGFHAGLGMVVNPLAGRLSDKLGRRTVLMIAFGGGALGLVLLARATTLLDFWIAALFLALVGAKDAVAPAFVTDLVAASSTPEQLERHMSVFSTSRWLGNVIGFAATGHVMEYVGLSATLIIAASLPLIGILVLNAFFESLTQESARP